MTEVRDRKALLALLESVNEGNRSFFTKFGKWEKPQIKVFWVEVDKRFKQRVLQNLGAQSRDREFYEWTTNDKRYWIDAADDRIWQIYTLSETGETKRDLKQLFQARGADRLWFPERFLDSTRKSMNYDDRGFGLSFRNLLADSEDAPLFSAKFWLSQTDSLTGKDGAAKRRFIDAGRAAFALSTVRFGRNVSSDGKGLSGQLYELYHDGHLTVTTCDDTSEMLALLSNIRSRYKDEVKLLEHSQEHRAEVIEVAFDSNVPSARLTPIVEQGKKPLGLWLHPYAQDGDLTRYNGVDLHTGDFLNIDVGLDYSYLTAEKHACMNVAPRFGTLAARFLSSKARIYHDGVELFA